MRIRRAIVSATLLGLFASDVVPALADPAASGSPWAATFGAVPVTSPSWPSIASGRLTASGHASVGAEVVLWAQPYGSDTPVPLTRSETTRGGKWAVSLRPGTDLARYVDVRAGTVNFSVQTFDGIGSDSYFFSAQTGTSFAGLRSQMTNALDAGSAAVGPTNVVLAVDPSQTRNIALSSDKAPLVSSHSGPNGTTEPETCHSTLLASYPSVKTWVGFMSSEVSGTAENLHYATGVSSSLGVGFQGSSGWSLSGTQSHSSTVGVDFPTEHNIFDMNYYETTTYHKVRETCGGHSTASNKVFVEPYAISTGGFTYEAASAIHMPYCEYVGAGISVHKNSTSAFVNNGGVSTSGIIGINLSAQSGYTKSLDEDYGMGSEGHHWCGHDDYPGSGTSRLQDIVD